MSLKEKDMGTLGKVRVGRKFHREYILCVMAPSRGRRTAQDRKGKEAGGPGAQSVRRK